MPGRRADHAVLGELPDLGERRSIETETPVLVEGERDGTLDRGGG